MDIIPIGTILVIHVLEFSKPERPLVSQDVKLPDYESTELSEDEDEDLIKSFAHQSLLSSQQFRWSVVSSESQNNHSH
jgi:hypothetical protein